MIITCMAKGIDVSVYQSRIDWVAVEESGEVDFAYMRAVIGTSSDVTFKRNWEECGKTSIKRGAYHFFKMNIDPAKQAQAFFDVVGALRDDDLPPMLDVEVHRLPTDDANAYLRKTLAFIEKAQELFGRRIVVYTGGPIFNECTDGGDPDLLDKIAACDLWLSAYVFDPTKFVPKAWKSRGKSWTIWQLSGDVAAGGKPGKRIKGIGPIVDYNVTQGSALDLKAWIAASVLNNQPAPATDQHADVLPVIEVEAPTHVEPIEPRPAPAPLVVVTQQQSTGIFAFLISLIKAILMLFSRRQ